MSATVPSHAAPPTGAARRMVTTVALMQARDLARRRVALALFVLLPASFYLSIPAEEDYGVLAGAIGVSWAVSAAGLFGTLGWRAVEPRLALLGARSWQRLLGRAAVLLGMVAVLVAVFTGLMLVRSSAVITDEGAFVTALALLAVASVPLGLALGTLARNELEGTLAIIGVVGVQMSMPPDATGAVALPLYGPVQALEVAVGRGDSIVPGLAHTSVVAALLTALAWWGFTRRGAIRPSTPTDDLDHHGLEEEPR